VLAKDGSRFDLRQPRADRNAAQGREKAAPRCPIETKIATLMKGLGWPDTLQPLCILPKVRCSTTNWWPAPPNWAWTGSPRALRVAGRPYYPYPAEPIGDRARMPPASPLLADRAPGIRVWARLGSLGFLGRRRCHRLWRGRHGLRRLTRGRLLGGGLGCPLRAGFAFTLLVFFALVTDFRAATFLRAPFAAALPRVDFFLAFLLVALAMLYLLL